MLLFLLACTPTEADSATFTGAERDTLAEECSPWTGIVGLGTTWTYNQTADRTAAGIGIESVSRVTYVDGPNIKIEWLHTTTVGDPPRDDTGEEFETDSVVPDEITTTHDTNRYTCEADGLHLESQDTKIYAGSSPSGSPASSGKRTLDPPPLVLPFDPVATTSWSAAFAGTSTLPGDNPTVAYTRSCTAAPAATIETGMGAVSGVEIICVADDGVDAHGDAAFYASNAGRVLDVSLVLVAYDP